MSTNKKKISVLVFNNFTNDSRVLKEATSLSKSGYNVQVIAHLDKGLKKLEKGLFTTKRVSYLDRTNASFLTKIIAYIKFILGAIKESKDSDFVHCNDLNTLPIGYLIKKIFNSKIKIVYDAHEYETEINNLKGLKKKLVKFGEKKLIRHADLTFSVSDAIANEYSRMYPFIKTPKLILNCPNYREVEKNDIFRHTFDISSDSKIFLFQGNLSQGRGIEITIEAFKKTTNKNNVIIFMGYGNLENRIKEESKKEVNIFFHEAVTQEKLLYYTSSADVGILFYENSCLNHYYCSPNKMFEYIMAEIPVIISNLYEMKKIITSCKVGVIAKENTTDGLLEAIDEANNLDKKQTQLNLLKTKKIYNWENQEKELLTSYKHLESKDYD